MSAVLTDEMRQAGESLVRELDARKVLAKAAFWLYVTDRNDWRLIIATPKLKSDGPKKGYRAVQQALAKVHSPLRLSSITVVDTKDPLIKSLSSVVNTGSGISGIRLPRGAINGHLIEDAYIYRMAA